MALSDHLQRVKKMRAVVTTVDPSNREIHVRAADGGDRQLAIFDVPSQWTWPKAGETWSIYEENGYWMLGNKFLDPEEDTHFRSMREGDSLTAKEYTTSLNGSTQTTFLIQHFLKNPSPVVSITETTQPFGLVFDASATDVSFVTGADISSYPSSGLLWMAQKHELVKYTSWSYSGISGYWTFSGLTRGYAGTLASAYSTEEGSVGYLTLNQVSGTVVQILDQDRLAINLPAAINTYAGGQLKVTVIG